MTSQTPLLEIRDLSVAVQAGGEERVVSKGFNLSVHKGETVGIVGESGSGKTMSMLALTRLLPPQAYVKSGEILLDGKPLNEVDKGAFERTISGRRIAMIFQEPMTALNPVYKIGRQLTEAVLFQEDISHEQAEKRAVDMLKSVRMPEPELRMNQYPHQLSGGQRQRVMIAMALMGNPDILIADEPTTALDVTVQDEIINLLISLQKELGMTMIFISHDLGVVSRISEKILVMEKGVIVERGSTEQVLTAPSHAYTQRLLGCLWKLEDSSVEGGAQVEEAAAIVTATDIAKSYHLSPGIFKTARIIHALREMSFEVKRGETLAIVGESGSGKSTLAKILNGLLLPDSGTVTIDGNALGDLSFMERAKLVQPIFQDPYSTLNPVHTVGYAVARPLMIHEGLTFKQVQERVLQVLDSVGLPREFFNRFPNQLSGGQRQRVAVARAIILKPKVLICDEPTSALDVSVQEQILDLLVELREELGMTLIIISHDMAVIGYLASRVLVMHEGAIIEQGPAEDVLQKPQMAYTQKLMASVYKVPRSNAGASDSIGGAGR